MHTLRISNVDLLASFNLAGIQRTQRHGFFNQYYMLEKNHTGIIPGQETGASIDTISVAALDTAEAAKAFFETVSNRLLHVNEWHSLAGNLSATFQLTDSNGNEVQGEAKEGYHIRIDIPGPGTAAGEGYDWVVIEAIRSIAQPDIESRGIRVRPTANPLSTDPDIAHFYSEKSTSSFTITREGNTVTAAIYDRNTEPNKRTSAIVDKVRDAIVGATGIAGMSKLQWKKLADGLLQQS